MNQKEDGSSSQVRQLCMRTYQKDTANVLFTQLYYFVGSRIRLPCSS